MSHSSLSGKGEWLLIIPDNASLERAPNWVCIQTLLCVCVCVCVCVCTCARVRAQLFQLLIWSVSPHRCGLPSFSVLGIFQSRILEWVAISSSRGSFPPRDRIWVSCICRWILSNWAAWEALLSNPYLPWVSSHIYLPIIYHLWDVFFV